MGGVQQVDDNPSGGFLRNVLSEFGIEWTHIALLSGLVFTFGLQDYFDSGVWMIATIGAFSSVFVFRRQISPRFPWVAFVSTLVGIGALVSGHLVALNEAMSVTAYLRANQVVGTGYVALAVMTPVAVMMLSYRQQETIYGGPFPPELREAIMKNLVHVPFYKRNLRYELTALLVVDRRLLARLTLSYTLVNRSKRAEKYDVGITPTRRPTKVIEASIGERHVPLNDPSYWTQRGFVVPHRFPPGETRVIFVAEVEFRIPDTDLMTTYVPSTDFELMLIYPKDELEIVVVPLVPETPDFEDFPDGERRRLAGVMPYQGFKLDWFAKDASAEEGTSA